MEQELILLKKQINLYLECGGDSQNIEELRLFLAESPLNQELKQRDGQLRMMDCFLDIWMKERREFPGSAVDIFYQVDSLGKLENKYRKIMYCALRAENRVPKSYMDQALEWMEKQRVSGIAIGEITALETEKKVDNLLYLAQELKRREQIFNATLLLQYANKRYPGKENLLLEEADCWMQGQQWRRAYDLLTQLENPVAEIQDIIIKLQQVLENI